MSTTYVSTAADDLILLDDRDATSATKRGRLGVVGTLLGILVLIESLCAAHANGVPLVGGNGLCPNASNLAHYIMENYPGVSSIGGVRNDRLPDHPSGHAIDIMVNDMGLGDTIAADVNAQSGRFGVKYVLWRVADHFNHVHVTVL